MKHSFTLFFLILFIVIKAQQSIIIQDINIISMLNDKVISHQDVVIKDGIIQKITSHSKNIMPSKGITYINGAGKFLMPGLVDMHVHLPDGSEPLTKQQAYNYYLESGVTALRSMRGELSHPAHRDSIELGLISAPQLYISCALPGADSLLSSNDINELVKTVKTKRYVFVKYLFGISEPKIKEVAGILKDSNITLAGHAYKDLKTSIELGLKSIEHISPLLDAYKKDSVEFYKLLQLMNSKNVSFCATASFSEIFGLANSIDENMNRYGMNRIDTSLANFWTRDYISFVDQCKRKQGGEDYSVERKKKTEQDLQLFYKLLPQLIKANVNVLLSPDNCLFNVPGYAMFEEMKLYKQSCLSNYDILKTATTNAYKFFEERKWCGVISEGYRANLILLDRNPLVDLENIKTVTTTIVKGKVLYQKK